MENEELDLKELFTIFWNKKGTIILVVILFAIMGAVYSLYLVNPVYTASTTLILVSTNKKSDEATETASSLQTELNVNSKLVSTYSELIKSKSVLREVADELSVLKLDEKDLRKNITVSSVKDTELIQIQVKNEKPFDSAEIANEIAKVFSAKVKEIYKLDNVYVVDRAEVPDKPSNDNYKKNIAIFAMVGLVLSAGYVLLVNLLDTTVKDPEDIEKSMKVAVLSSIPYNQDK